MPASSSSPSRSVPIDVIDHCPDCGDRDFLIDEHQGDTVFRCLGCTAGWRYSLGYILRVETTD